jgi:hypothetical protein
VHNTMIISTSLRDEGVSYNISANGSPYASGIVLELFEGHLPIPPTCLPFPPRPTGLQSYRDRAFVNSEYQRAAQEPTREDGWRFLTATKDAAEWTGVCEAPDVSTSKQQISLTL